MRRSSPFSAETLSLFFKSWFSFSRVLFLVDNWCTLRLVWSSLPFSFAKSSFRSITFSSRAWRRSSCSWIRLPCSAFSISKTRLRSANFLRSVSDASKRSIKAWCSVNCACRAVMRLKTRSFSYEFVAMTSCLNSASVRVFISAPGGTGGKCALILWMSAFTFSNTCARWAWCVVLALSFSNASLWLLAFASPTAASVAAVIDCLLMMISWGGCPSSSVIFIGSTLSTLCGNVVKRMKDVISFEFWFYQEINSIVAFLIIYFCRWRAGRRRRASPRLLCSLSMDRSWTDTSQQFWPLFYVTITIITPNDEKWYEES